VLSHPDSDHIGGLPAICRRFRVGKVAISEAFRDRAEVKKLIADCGLQKDQLMWTKGMQTAKLGDYKLMLFSPPNYAETDNDRSVVCKISDGAASCLFTGDLSSIEEDSLAAKKIDWSSQILKISHHGSRFSTDDTWLNAVKPEYAVVSVGRNNNYGHPSTDVLRRLNLHQAAILRTDIQGNLRFTRTQRGFALDDE
jgi:beta-lactamase superfamily II metal-dependent hydrolase